MYLTPLNTIIPIVYRYLSYSREGYGKKACFIFWDSVFIFEQIKKQKHSLGVYRKTLYPRLRFKYYSYISICMSAINEIISILAIKLYIVLQKKKKWKLCYVERK